MVEAHETYMSMKMLMQLSYFLCLYESFLSLFSLSGPNHIKGMESCLNLTTLQCDFALKTIFNI